MVFARVLTEYCASRSLAVQPLLQECRIDPALLQHNDGRIECRRFVRLCSLAAAQLHEPALGLHLGNAMRTAHLGPYGVALNNCETARATLHYMARYSRLMIDAGSSVLTESAGACTRYWYRNGSAEDPENRFLAELVFAVFVTMSRWVGDDPQLAPRWVAFRHGAPADVAPYQAVFGCPVHFGAAENAVCFDGDALNLAIPYAHPQVRTAMDALCERMLHDLARSAEPRWLANCRAAILHAMESGQPDIAQVAGYMRLSPTTLRRQLKRHDLGFRQLVDDLRREMALEQLRNPSMSLVDVAFLLGFSEQSAFQRAFKRWTGLTPGDWRRMHSG